MSVSHSYFDIEFSQYTRGKAQYMKSLISIFLILIFTSCQSPQTQYKNSAKLQQLVHSCQSCHSQGQKLLAPSLSGLEDWYIKQQLYKFQQGIRGGASAAKSAQTMHKAANMLSPEQIAFLAQWYSNQTPTPAGMANHDDHSNGKALYKENCAGCHDSGPGKFFTGSPSLKNLPDWYIIRQIKDFKSGKRGSHPQDDKGLKMAQRVQSLENHQIQDIASFLHSR